MIDPSLLFCTKLIVRLSLRRNEEKGCAWSIAFDVVNVLCVAAGECKAMLFVLGFVFVSA